MVSFVRFAAAHPEPAGEVTNPTPRHGSSWGEAMKRAHAHLAEEARERGNSHSGEKLGDGNSARRTTQAEDCRVGTGGRLTGKSDRLANGHSSMETQTQILEAAEDDTSTPSEGSEEEDQHDTVRIYGEGDDANSGGEGSNGSDGKGSSDDECDQFFLSPHGNPLESIHSRARHSLISPATLTPPHPYNTGGSRKIELAPWTAHPKSTDPKQIRMVLVPPPRPTTVLGSSMEDERAPKYAANEYQMVPTSPDRPTKILGESAPPAPTCGARFNM